MMSREQRYFHSYFIDIKIIVIVNNSTLYATFFRFKSLELSSCCGEQKSVAHILQAFNTNDTTTNNNILQAELWVQVQMIRPDKLSATFFYLLIFINTIVTFISINLRLQQFFHITPTVCFILLVQSSTHRGDD